jgi:hypothetical protein
MKQQTTVEWLIKQIDPYGLSVHQEAFKTALEMERQQIIDAWSDVGADGVTTAEEYYNINFESK